MVTIFVWGQQGSTLPNEDYSWNSAISTYGDGHNGHGNGDGWGNGEVSAYPDGNGYGTGMDNGSSGDGPLC